MIILLKYTPGIYYLEGGEHRDFPPLADVDFLSLEFLKYT